MKQLFFYFNYLICIPLIIAYLCINHVILAIKSIFSYSSIVPWLDKRIGKNAKQILQLLALFLKIKITTYDLQTFRTIKLETPMLILSNHQSLLDILALNYLFAHIPIRYILKQTISYGFPYISAVTRIQRHAAIDRNNPKQSISQIKTLTNYSKRTGASISLFPEGTRSRDGKLLEFKTAAIKTILRKNPIPVAVVALHNSYVFPTLTNYTYFAPTNYYIKMLHVFPAVEMKDIPDIIEKSYSLIDTQLQEWNSTSNAKS